MARLTRRKVARLIIVALVFFALCLYGRVSTTFSARIIDNQLDSLQHDFLAVGESLDQGNLEDAKELIDDYMIRFIRFELIFKMFDENDYPAFLVVDKDGNDISEMEELQRQLGTPFGRSSNISIDVVNGVAYSLGADLTDIGKFEVSIYDKDHPDGLAKENGAIGKGNLIGADLLSAAQKANLSSQGKLKVYIGVEQYSQNYLLIQYNGPEEKLLARLANNRAIANVCLFVMFLTIAAYWLLLPLWVWKDAATMGGKAARWAIIVFATNLIGLVAYQVQLIHKRDEAPARYCAVCGGLLTGEGCGCQPDKAESDGACPSCGKSLERDWVACPWCGKNCGE